MVAVSLKKFFFFQAEDGIRDQPRSRGLGDVYKRQGQDGRHPGAANGHRERDAGRSAIQRRDAAPVSYTHLTLPTNREV